jgi:uncharacterized protein (UPF0332 family)
MINYNKQDYINYRLQRAKETLKEAEMLIDNKFWNTAVNRMYYACFYAVSSLLIKHNIESSTHSGTRQKFGEFFVKPGIIEKHFGKHFSDLFEKRTKGDYNDFFEFDEETVARLFPLTQQFIERLDYLIGE